MHRVAAGLGAVGRELTKGSDAHSPRKRMEKFGFGKTYGQFRNKWSRPGEEIAKLLRLSKGVPYWQKKTLEQEARNLDQKAESPKEQQIVDKELDMVAESLKKDPKVAAMWVDKVLANLRAGDRFAKEKRVSKGKVGEIVRGTSGIPREVKEYFASAFEGREQYQEKSEDKWTTQAEIAAKIQELKTRGVLKEGDVVEVEKKLGAEEFSADRGSAREAKGQTFAQKRGIGAGSVARTREAAREGSPSRSGEGGSALNRLKSFITK